MAARKMHNPYKAAIPLVSGIALTSNPLLRPRPTLAMSVEDGAWYNENYEDEFPEVEILLFETPIRGLESLVGGIYVRQGVIEDDTDKWVVEGSAALTGYGPLLYDIAARVVGAPISPSLHQSMHAERFWGRQDGRRIRNLSDAEFAAKYGVSYIPGRDPGPMRQAFQDAVKQAFGHGIPLDRSVRTMPKANPADLAGRHIPERYLAGLPPKLQQQRIWELTQSRDAYWKGDYSELPTDVTARKMGLVKQSKYTTEAKKRGIEYRGNFYDMARRVFDFYGHRPSDREVSAFGEALRSSFAKGLAAWKSGGHRPGATAQNWAVARVNSLVVGGKTSWTADKKQFAVLPEAVRAKIESMRMLQNPIKVEVHGKPNAAGGSRHLRFFASQAALDRIEAQGADVVPNIKFIVEWDPAHRWGNRVMKGMPDIITLLASPDAVESFHESVTEFYGDLRRTRISPYTAHTILHRLGDKIMPDTDNYKGAYITSPVKREMAKVGYVPDRAEEAYENLRKALSQADFLLGNYAPTVRGKMVNTLKEWLPLVVDTKACREGWVDDAGQAMAELVPYRVLYKKGREQGVKLMSDMPFVPRLEAALTEYIDANLDMLKGYLVEI